MSTLHRWFILIKCHVKFGKQWKAFFAIAAVMMMTDNDNNSMYTHYNGNNR